MRKEKGKELRKNYLTVRGVVMKMTNIRLCEVVKERGGDINSWSMGGGGTTIMYGSLQLKGFGRAYIITLVLGFFFKTGREVLK